MREPTPRVARFYFDGDLQTDALAELPEEAARHAQVRRLRAGEAAVLFNGRGGEYAARIVECGRSRVRVQVGAWSATEREAPLAVTLVQGVSSGEKMDLTVQKATELGAAAIQPLLGEKAVVRLSAARAQVKLVHWRHIVISACEQCGRNRLPEIAMPMSVTDYCRQPPVAGLRLLLSPDAPRGLREAVAEIPAALAIAAGPEGGFSRGEEALLVAAGFAPVRLGPRVLRTETAALAALAALNALAGDF
jgi:16S rRNA (uracil1498-N3)-methyltransferase